MRTLRPQIKKYYVCLRLTTPCRPERRSLLMVHPQVEYAKRIRRWCLYQCGVILPRCKHFGVAVG